MALALLLLDLAGLVGYLLTLWFGFRSLGFADTQSAALMLSFRKHTGLAIPTLMFVLFGQSMTMFYFIGLGKQAREAAEAISETAGRRMRALVRAQKGPVFRSATLAVTFAITVYVLGGAVHVHKVRPAWHLTAGLAALFFHLQAIWSALVGMSDLHDWLENPGGAPPPEAPNEEPATEEPPISK